MICSTYSSVPLLWSVWAVDTLLGGAVEPLRGGAVDPLRGVEPLLV